MNKFVRFLKLLAILSLSCSSVTDLFNRGGEVSGPIAGMTVAASRDDQGQPLGESFSFYADQPQMVVLVRMGDVSPGPLTINWYRVTEEGDEALFVQTVAVEARDSAFSTGLNPGILALGTYKVVASFAGGSETIVWDVIETQPEGLTVPVDTTGSAAGGTPTPGPSGKTRVVVPTIDPYYTEGPLAMMYLHPYNSPPVIEGYSVYSWVLNATTVIPAPAAYTIRVTAAIDGSQAEVIDEYIREEGSATGTRSFAANPCDLPGQQDLPGTRIRFTSFPLGFESREQHVTAVLPKDSSAPEVTLVSAPSNGVKVKAGQKIELSAIARELETGGSWQTGVSKVLFAVMQPSYLEIDKEPSGKSKADCTAKSWKQTTQKYFYTVPEGLKGDLRICAFGYDFADPPNVGKGCATFHTGNQVKGPLTSTTTSLTSAGNGGTYVDKSVIDLSLTLEDDGTLSGTAQIAYSYYGEGTQECGPWTHTFDPLKLTLPVSGEWTKEAIDFRFTIDTPITTTGTFTGCGKSETKQFDVRAATFGGNSVTVGESTNWQDWHADWDGQAYTADDTFSTPDIEWHWTIHLEPPAPAVGSSPPPGEAAQSDQSPMN